MAEELRDRTPSMTIVQDLKTTELSSRHARITQSILEWYDSWQIWQKKILITGIVNRFKYHQLRSLLVAVEPVFHKDFTASMKKFFQVNNDQESEITGPKIDNTFAAVELRKKSHKIRKSIPKQTAKKEADVVEDSSDETSTLTSTRSDDLEGSEVDLSESGPVTRATFGYQVVNSEERNLNLPRSGSDASHSILSPIEEDEAGQTEANTMQQETYQLFEAVNDLNIIEDSDIAGVPHAAVLISHLMNEVNSPGASQVSAHASSLSPIEENSSENTVVEPETSLASPERPDEAEQELAAEEDKKNKSWLKRLKNIKKKRGIPKNVLKRIANSSAWMNRPVSSNVSLTPIGAESTLSLTFHSGTSSLDVHTEDFFGKNATLLGEPVTTVSKLGQQLKDGYDFSRNFLPVPKTHQLYKGKKLWNCVTEETTVTRLKELFKEQLDQIWEWIGEWPSYKLTRLLFELFSKSSEKLIYFTAECVRAKTKEAPDIPPEIDILGDQLLLRIFSNLTPTELLTASYVCKRWNALLKSDELWKRKCDEIGLGNGIHRLSKLLSESAGDNQALDWKQAYVEVQQYLDLCWESLTRDQSSYSTTEMEDVEFELEDKEDSDAKFKDYVPFWKKFPAEEPKSESKLKDSAKERLASRLASLVPMLGDIKEDVPFDDGRSDACLDVDMFPDMQEWEDVGLFANIGQAFAVDFHLEDAMEVCSRNWPIEDHVIAVCKVQIFRGHTGPVNVAKCQGNRVFSGSSDRCVRVWSKSGQCFAKMSEDVTGGVNDISVGDSDHPKEMFVALWDMSIRVWNTITFRSKGTLTGHEGSVRKVAADKKFIVTCSHDGTIKVWDRILLSCDKTITCHDGAVESMIYHDRLIISGGVDKMIYVNNAFTGQFVRSYAGHQTSVTALKKQHDLLASGDMEGKVYFWTLATDDESHVDVIKAHESQINAIEMHGPTFFTASKDALVKEWDLVTMTAVRIFQGHTDAVTDVQWTEKFLLTCSRDNDVRVWWWRDSEGGEPAEEEKPKRVDHYSQAR